METVEIDGLNLFDGVYQGKCVLVTGHTGFKGSWLSLWLYLMGAKVVGYALDPATQRDNFVRCGLHGKIIDLRGDIRDAALLNQVFDTYRPEFVFHLAAQPIVRRSYENPTETFETNVMGTVNVLEAIRSCNSVKAGVIITSDKCYENREQIWGYREDDKMGGYDPYSASKGCAELVTSAYRNSFFRRDSEKSIATVRAGNVIGGGDWSDFRLLPDCVRAAQSQIPIEIRNPDSVRPWQFVLEPLYGYLLLGSKLFQRGAAYSGAWNFGPDFESIATVKTATELFAALWGGGAGIHCFSSEDAPHEAGLLSLDCTKAKTLLGWKPRLNLQQALEYTVEWYKNENTEDLFALCKSQIVSYCKLNGVRFS